MRGVSRTQKLTAIALILFGVVWLFPAYFTIQTSFLGKFTSPMNFWGRAHLFNWRVLPWGKLTLWASNTLVLCGIAAILSPLVCISAGYAFVRYNFRGKEVIFYLFLLAITIPGGALFLPRYLLVVRSGLRGSHLGMALPGIMLPASVFLARQFLSHIDMSIIEAARLDGASELRILRSIIFPLSLPLVLLNVITAFRSVYSDFFWQYLVGKGIKTFAVGIGLFILSKYGGGEMERSLTVSVLGSRSISAESVRAAVSVLQSLPILLLFIVGQKHFLKGIKI